jgi:hypothetical protein
MILNQAKKKQKKRKEQKKRKKKFMNRVLQKWSKYKNKWKQA